MKQDQTTGRVAVSYGPAGRYPVLMPSAMILLVYALAVARVTRLITTDRVLDVPRTAVKAWAWQRRIHDVGARAAQEPEPMLAYLATCPWCVSMYLGIALAAPVWFVGDSPWLAIPALALAFSQVTGLMARGE